MLGVDRDRFVTYICNMKYISILVPKGAASLACIDGAYNAFTKANDFLERTGKPSLFKVQLVALTDDAHVYERLFTVYPDQTIKDVEKTDLIIIPAVNGDMDKVIEINKDFFPWINKQYENGAEV